MANSQTVNALYDNGVLTPLEKVRLKKRQKVRVKITPLSERKRKPPTRRVTRKKPTREELADLARESFGMWADRADMGDNWIAEIRAGWEERMKEIYRDG